MEIAGFGVEEWLNEWETKATVDIAQSTIASMTMNEALNLDGQGGATFYEKLDAAKMNYGWIEGSPAFKREVAKLYQHVDVDGILQTNGATGANHLPYTPSSSRVTMSLQSTPPINSFMIFPSRWELRSIFGTFVNQLTGTLILKN